MLGWVARMVAGVAAVFAALTLADCTASGDDASPSSSVNPAPDDNDDSQDIRANLPRCHTHGL